MAEKTGKASSKVRRPLGEKDIEDQENAPEGSWAKHRLRGDMINLAQGKTSGKFKVIRK